MAKEKEQNDVIKDQFKLSSSVRRDGYYGVIDGTEFLVAFELDYEGKRKSRFASVGQYVGSGQEREFKSSDKDYFENLTPTQLRIFALGKVITLTPEQEKKYADTIHPKG